MKEKNIIDKYKIESFLDLVSITNEENDLIKLMDYVGVLESILVEKDNVSLVKDLFNQDSYQAEVSNYEFSLARISLVNAYYKMNIDQVKKDKIYKILNVNYLESNIDRKFLLGRTLLTTGDDPSLGLKYITEASLMGHRQARNLMEGLLKDEHIQKMQFYDVLDLSEKDKDTIDKSDLRDIRYMGRDNG